MSDDHDAEPVFVRSKWGTSRYVYNANNPVGMALIIASLLFAAGGMYALHDSSSWSEGELHDAVHAGMYRIAEGFAPAHGRLPPPWQVLRRSPWFGTDGTL
ncbi:hypothetical protein ACTMTU_18320 [Streptomyces sp. OZ13]|uniref:hypothetical protein n=1 Tax=Streptomyces sp. OZ13 TaxID=3452210 RepID=UPI003F8C9B36